MASTINASSSGSGGIVQTADASGVLQLQTNGTAALTVDTAQNVGVGVTPSAWTLGANTRAIEFSYGAVSTSTQNLAVSQNAYYNGTNWIYKTTSYASLYNQGSGAHVWYNAPSGTAGNAITLTQAMVLDANGNLGVGTASASYARFNAAVANNATFQPAIYATNATNSDFQVRIKTSVTDIGTTTSTPLTFSIANTEVVRIDSGGNVLVGGSASAVSSTKLQVQNSNIAIYRDDGQRNVLTFVKNSGTTQTWNTQLKSDANQNYYMIANPAETVGVYMTPGASGWNNLSDERFKTNWVELTNALSGVMSLRAGTFNWVKDPTLPRDVGVIAQDVLQVLPEAVNTIDPDELGVRYTHLVPMLIKAIQEQNQLITSLTERITALEGEKE
jgi:hypothetical protein